MLIFKTNNELNDWRQQLLSKNNTLGFVPTMGALHQGHISLVEKSLSENHYTIVSIYVNPKQFNDVNDLNKYPKTIEEDIAKLKKIGCQALYIPDNESIYPKDFKTISLNLGGLKTILEGPNRPGHFEGVVQVVYQLFKLVIPNKVYLGLKDYQQCKVIELMRDTYFKSIELDFCPTYREDSGLAMSSRNMRLSEQGKMKAASIYKTLKALSALRDNIAVNNALDYGKHLLKSKGIEAEYVALVNAKTFKLSNKWLSKNNNVILIACYVENIRLIDNIQF